MLQLYLETCQDEKLMNRVQPPTPLLRRPVDGRT